LTREDEFGLMSGDRLLVSGHRRAVFVIRCDTVSEIHRRVRLAYLSVPV
jgi:hypothetical protein